MELFERAVKGGGQLLRAEVSPLGGRTDAVSCLLLTFDLGRIAVRADAAASSLEVEYLASPDDAPPGLQDASEEEPWWRVLGSPLARAREIGADAPGGVCIQFRADDQNPRVVTLQPRAGGVAIRLESPPNPEPRA